MRCPCVALSDCCEFLDHIRRPVKESERVNGPYPYFGANGQQGWINDYLFDEPLVLLAEDGGHFSNPERGIAYKITGKTWVNNHAHVLRPREKIIDIDYLAHALKNKDVRRQLSGSTRDKLTKAGASQIKISLPPLEEQRRIAAILDKASSVMKHTDARLQTFKTFENSLFNHFFGRALDQQTLWDCIPFGELCHRLTVGVVVKPASYYRETGIPALRSLNVRRGSIEQSNFVYISDEDNNNTLSKSKLSAGDLVFVRSGRPGTCAVIPQNLDGCNAIDLLLATSDTSKIMPEFAASYFNSIAGKALVSSESKGQVQQHFNAGSLKTSLIPVPPIELQEEFCKALSKSKALLGNHNVSLQRLEEIFRSLQQTLLLG